MSMLLVNYLDNCPSEYSVSISQEFIDTYGYPISILLNHFNGHAFALPSIIGSIETTKGLFPIPSPKELKDVTVNIVGGILEPEDAINTTLFTLSAEVENISLQKLQQGIDNSNALFGL